MNERLEIRPEDLDEASIYFYRLWARVLLGEEPEALVLKEPEYVVIGREWTLFCSRNQADPRQVALVAEDTGRAVLCASPRLCCPLVGLDVETGAYSGPQELRSVAQALVRSAAELPAAAKDRDPKLGRWIRRSTGTFEIWIGRQFRLICRDTQGDFGYTWDQKSTNIYFYRSKSCKREGKQSLAGSFKVSEQKRTGGLSFLNIDLLSADGSAAALLHLTPAGAGYKAFTRQLPASFRGIEPLYH